MKNLFTNTFIKYVFYSVIFVLITFSGINAQDGSNIVVSLNKESIDNLKNAITSDNPGLRKSGIYLAGKHSIDQVAETLVTQLEKENDPELKILIMRVLYIIDENRYKNEIYNLATTDQNIRVRKMAAAIYSAMQINNGEKVADNEN